MQLPAQIGKYELQEFLGGGMSHVYRAQDQVIGRTVVVKILTEAGVNDPESKARFLQEARLAGNIQHDNVVNIHDYGEEQGRPYIVMEYLRGEDLREAIRKGSLGSLDNKLRIALQISHALAYVHSLNIIHRDVKPENVRLDANGRVKLMDFGIAKSMNFSVTQAGMALGTPYYMAPELISGKPATELVDVYAFGILFYELLTGDRPIKGDTLEHIFYLIVQQPIDLAPLATAGAPDSVVDLIRRCAAKKAEERIQSFQEVSKALERILSEGDQPTMQHAAEPGPTVAIPSVKRRSWLMPVVLLLVLMSAAAAGLFWFLRGKAPEKMLATETGVMVLVDAGPFESGPEKKTITLPAFYIDETEVSNARYAAFSKASGHALPSGFPANAPDLPVVNVTMDDARAYARWAGKRVPTSLEWEKAARGTDGAMFPWGNERDPKRANVTDNPDLKEHALMPVNGRFAGSLSPYGAYHMVGNALELVESSQAPSSAAVEHFSFLNPPATGAEKWCQLRGGSFRMSLADAAVFESASVPERFSGPDIGFRCVRDVK